MKNKKGIKFPRTKGKYKKKIQALTVKGEEMKNVFSSGRQQIWLSNRKTSNTTSEKDKETNSVLFAPFVLAKSFTYPKYI